MAMKSRVIKFVGLVKIPVVGMRVTGGILKS